jgi:hypothetical protein
LANSCDVVASGIETINDNRYAIWWRAHGYKVLVDAPLAQFPAWLAAEARGGGMGTAVQARANGHGAGAVVPIPRPTGPVTQFQKNYAWKSVCNAWDELRRCRQGSRNATLNGLAYSLGRQIVRGWVSQDKVEFWLMRACQENGLLDDDGIEQCRKTLASGIGAGLRYPYRDIEPPQP